MKSQLKIGVAIGSSLVQSFPSHDVTKISLEEEIEDLSKRSRDLKLSLRPELPKQQVKEVATKEVWLRLKEIFKVESSVARVSDRFYIRVQLHLNFIKNYYFVHFSLDPIIQSSHQCGYEVRAPFPAV